MRYGKRNSGGEHGSVMTNPLVVDFILDVCGYSENEDLSKLKILEPGTGYGAFIFKIIERLFLSSKKYNFSFEKALQENILGVEIDTNKVFFLQEKIANFLSSKNIRNGHQITKKIIRNEDYLKGSFGIFDIVIGNPPYVRHEQIPEEQKKEYRRIFSSFRNRSDLYVAFYEKSLSLLKRNGKLCFICADRWMKNKYGEQLREYIENGFNMSLVVDIQNSDVFDESVDAYPAITLIEKTDKKGCLRTKLESVNDFKSIKATFLKNESTFTPFSFSPEIMNREDLWSIEEQGFKIGIGVASGADKVFVKEDFGDIEKELLIPLVKSGNIINGAIKGADSKILNPYIGKSGELINLDNYPQAKKYLNSHKLKLTSRHIAKKNHKNWYKTIDRIYPELVHTPKILIPDIKKNSDSVVLDVGKYHPHHNIYYITHQENNTKQLEVLGGFLLSSFVHEQMKNISVTMRGGCFRWQAQNLRKIKIPYLNLIREDLSDKLRKAFLTRNIEKIDAIIEEINEYLKTIPSTKQKPLVIKHHFEENLVLFANSY